MKLVTALRAFGALVACAMLGSSCGGHEHDSKVKESVSLVCAAPCVEVRWWECTPCCSSQAQSASPDCVCECVEHVACVDQSQAAQSSGSCYQ